MRTGQVRSKKTSKTQNHIGEDGNVGVILLLVVEQVLEPLARQQHRGAEPPDDILRRLWPPDRRARQVEADVLWDRALAETARASCRSRECQYMSRQVVAELLNIKQKQLPL